MSNQTNQIKCPECSAVINIKEALYAQLKQEHSLEITEAKKDLKKQQDQLAQNEKNLNEEREQVRNAIELGISKGLKESTKESERKIRKKITQEKEDQIDSMEKELEEKSSELKKFNKAKSEIEKLKREKSELKSELDAENEKILTIKLKEGKKAADVAAREKYELTIRGKNQVIEQQMKQLQEAQRKIEQGSEQSQGEIQEIAIEEWLRANFPLDTIEEIKKGAAGADCLQHVNTRERQNCGKIYYESKNTKAFQPTWIEKFKKDMQDVNANIGILVTKAMPSDLDRMGLLKGVWICSFEEFKGLCAVLRESVVQINSIISSQENKSEKKEMLYDFLNSNEFKLQFESIVEAFTQMKGDLDTEKRSTLSSWKKREKQIEKVILNTINMYSSFKGIAGSSILTIKQLEPPKPEDE